MNFIYNTLVDLSIRTGVFTRWYLSEGNTIFTNDKGVSLSFPTTDPYVEPKTLTLTAKGSESTEFSAEDVKKAFEKATVLSA